MVNTLFDFVEMTCLYLLEDVFRKKLSKNEKKNRIFAENY